MYVDELLRHFCSAVSEAPMSERQARAAVCDFFRLAHETMVKSERNQKQLLEEVRVALGLKAMRHLACLIDGDLSAPSFDIQEPLLDDKVEAMFDARGIQPEQGRAMLLRILEGMDTLRYDASGSSLSPSSTLYFVFGDECAYHYGGLYVDDAADDVATELVGYLDPQMRRFHHLVQIWEHELAYTKSLDG